MTTITKGRRNHVLMMNAEVKGQGFFLFWKRKKR